MALNTEFFNIQLMCIKIYMDLFELETEFI